MISLRTPILSKFIREGGSGGALALTVGIKEYLRQRLDELSGEQ